MQPGRFWAFFPKIPLIKDDNRIRCQPLLNHLIGAQQYRLRHRQTKRALAVLRFTAISNFADS
jgi:hypothetical protein